MTGESLKLKTRRLISIVSISTLLAISISFLFTLTHYQAKANTNEVGTVLNTGGFINFDDYNGNITIDSETGSMFGFVWSSDLGWIDFSNNGSDGVKVNTLDGKLSGKALVVNTQGFLDFTNNGSNVAIDLKNGSMSGFVWSEDIGWIGFSGVSSRIAGAIGDINSLQALTQVGLNLLILLENILFAISIICGVSLLVIYARQRSFSVG